MSLADAVAALAADPVNGLSTAEIQRRLERFGPNALPEPGERSLVRVGITLPMLGVSLVAAILTIGIVTALASIGGLFVGRRFGAMLGQRFEAIGGLMLIALAAKVLAEHMTAGR